jgi:hypothetical protein
MENANVFRESGAENSKRIVMAAQMVQPDRVDA